MKGLLVLFVSFFICGSYNTEVGTIIDVYNGIPVIYNGQPRNVHGRHITRTGYNLGLKWQCVEYVKRYYYFHYNHEFPQSYGHAKAFFDTSLGDVAYNEDRDLWQFRNVRYERPQEGDILVYTGEDKNPYGHVAIITEVNAEDIEVIQQNVRMDSRQRIALKEYNGIYTIADYNILGWLRKL